MKVIVAGSTGLVGSALVRQGIASDNVSRVWALTRRPLPDAVADNPKVGVLLHDDYSTYPPELLAKLAGAEACLWLVCPVYPAQRFVPAKLTRARAIGGRATQFPDAATYEKVQVDYALAAARAFVAALAPHLPEGKPFRFVFCSGKFAEWDQAKPLHFMADTRRVKVRPRPCAAVLITALCFPKLPASACLILHHRFLLHADLRCVCLGESGTGPVRDCRCRHHQALRGLLRPAQRHPAGRCGFWVKALGEAVRCHRCGSPGEGSPPHRGGGLQGAHH